ncbi:histidine phosphatase family protein [Patescibacteria group bacterium]|nr:histidine phosphatase family protein [Patescibacteria group bacterium]
MKHEEPTEISLVRHGEARGEPDTRDRATLTRPLTELGKEQARAAGDWLRTHQPSVDKFYVAPARRAVNTAGLLALPDAAWELAPLLSERNRGRQEQLSDTERATQFPEYLEEEELAPIYFRPPNGESMLDVASRIQLHIEQLVGMSSVNVAHLDSDNVARIVVEGALVKEIGATDTFWQGRPGEILQYSSVDPDSGKAHPELRFRRAHWPWGSDTSPEWEAFEKPTFSNEDLIEMAEGEVYPLVNDSSSDSPATPLVDKIRSHRLSGI